jgi:GTPase
MVKRTVKSIEVWHQQVKEAGVGTQVGISIKNTSYYEFRNGWRGFLIGSSLNVMLCNKVKAKTDLGNHHLVGKRIN